MNKKAPVSAYRLLSSPCDKSIVFVSSRRSPCTTKNKITLFILIILQNRVGIFEVSQVRASVGNTKSFGLCQVKLFLLSKE